VRVGALVAVSGTTGIDDAGRVVEPGDAGAQTARALANVAAALAAVGARREDVVRTRIYVTDVSRWEEVAAAHAAALGHVRPECTMVEVAHLTDPAMLVEVEVDAVVTED
jgi:enamine deaminase RidA (YjgF/YER057c/UK114 family)